jgi:hypothetical protein
MNHLHMYYGSDVWTLDEHELEEQSQTTSTCIMAQAKHSWFKL